MDITNNIQNVNKPFEPTFLNIEFFFNKVFDVLDTLSNVISKSLDLYINPLLIPIFIFLSIVFFLGIIFLIFKIHQIRKKEKESLAGFLQKTTGHDEKNERWEMVLNHLESQNPTDWRMAILEADNILEDMVKKMGYDGENLGERLKAVEVSDFNNLQNAWEAHKVRNKIAHEGSGFDLTKKEANRIIQLYEKVFREFEFI